MYISSSIDDKIFCPSCSNFLISKDNIENREDIEFSTLKCQNCSFEYTFLYCKKCAQKIFMKIDPNPTPKEYNGLNGYNSWNIRDRERPSGFRKMECKKFPNL